MQTLQEQAAVPPHQPSSPPLHHPTPHCREFPAESSPESLWGTATAQLVLGTGAASPGAWEPWDGEILKDIESGQFLTTACDHTAVPNKQGQGATPASALTSGQSSQALPRSFLPDIVGF